MVSVYGYGIVIAGTAAVLYIVRKIREYQWGWVRSKTSLKGRTFIITGANAGLGYETTRHMIKRGATVIMGCRDLERANKAMKKIRSETQEGQMICIKLDLASMNSVRDFANKILTQYPVFDCLINNAGLAIAGSQKKYTSENYEIHMGVNHLGHFLLYNLLENNIQQNNSRVVVVASKMLERGQIDFKHFGKYPDDGSLSHSHKNPYYNNSKLANFYFARQLYKNGVDCHVLCPGLCHTEFFRDYNPRWYHYVMLSPVVLFMLRSAEQGAQNIVHCATDNKNTTEKNPATGYYVRSLVQEKAAIQLDDAVSERLWSESIIACSLKSEL